jgi:hypothetical protein
LSERHENIAYWRRPKAKPGFAKDKELVSLGERIYRGGIADRQIAACALPQPGWCRYSAVYLRLAGQHAEYTATAGRLP